MNDATATQLRLIGEIRDVLDAAGVEWWLFGGWAMDFHAGEVTREHSDIEIFIWLSDAAGAKDALVTAGFAAPPSSHPDEAQPFLKDGQEIGAWYIVRGEDGTICTPGRWSNWPWPGGSLDEPRTRIGDVEAPAMSAEGLLDMKVGFAKHPHGAPLREKDRADIARLRTIISQRGHAISFFLASARVRVRARWSTGPGSLPATITAGLTLQPTGWFSMCA